MKINSPFQWICELFLLIKYFIQLSPNIVQVLWRDLSRTADTDSSCSQIAGFFIGNQPRGYSLMYSE